MKKILITAATTVFTIAPAAAAHASTGSDSYGGNGTNTTIAATENQGYSTASSTNSGANASVAQYSNKMVSYEALYYVKYDASETNYLAADWSEWNKTNDNAHAFDNTTAYFRTMMGGGNWGHQE